ncbi:MAG: hypothetical protein E6726_08865 [Clostridium sp.]|uniref:hypothetical protein n=1 Tax=Clostridium sp. TaxID=1506 RepID=UPI0028FFDA9F|nr:hypothetical protein [Clostridium sp.]MDU1978503.1 hypothetical protein [Clostridium sp.]MDU1994699.1 hypothetical protein [Clostridium sp.]MDU6048358.1 hypothetical protein [Clostridium sp.]MDU6222416.1 hypothetical protein [Clostridium sp.]MDU6273607.1 hypothetical protein [Clostridium sp.]
MFNYEYKLILALGNKQIDIAMLKPFFEEARKDFNDYSITLIKNKKYIRDFHVDREKNTLIIYLQSEKKLPIAVRGLRYYTQIIISRMGSNNEKFGELTGKELLEKIINKNSFFRTIEVEEVNIAEEKIEKKTEKIKEKDVLINELEKRIVKLERKIERFEKIIKVIELEKRDYLMNLSKEESEWMDEMFCNDKDLDEENNEAFDKFDT